jgi:hypothetical protein
MQGECKYKLGFITSKISYKVVTKQRSRKLEKLRENNHQHLLSVYHVSDILRMSYWEVLHWVPVYDLGDGNAMITLQYRELRFLTYKGLIQVSRLVRDTARIWTLACLGSKSWAVSNTRCLTVGFDQRSLLNSIQQLFFEHPAMVN